jgi:TP901 family phage tail tape measure protein
MAELGGFIAGFAELFDNYRKMLTKNKQIAKSFEDIESTTLRFSGTLNKMEKGIETYTVKLKEGVTATLNYDAATKKVTGSIRDQSSAIEELSRLQVAQQNIQKRNVTSTAKETTKKFTRAFERNDLGYTASGLRDAGKQQDFQNYVRMKAELVDFVAANKISAQQLSGMWKNIQEGKLKVYTGVRRKIQDQLLRFYNFSKRIHEQDAAAFKAAQDKKDAAAAAARKARSRAFDERDAKYIEENKAHERSVAAGRRNLSIRQKLYRAIGLSEKAQKKLNKSAEGFHISWRSVVRLVGVQFAHRAVASATRALREGIQAAIEFEKRIAEIRTISQDSQLPFDEWADSAKRLSDSWGLGIMDVAEGAYQTLSNQVAEGATTFLFMQEAAQLAVTAVGTTADSVNLLTAAINSMDRSVYETEELSAKFFKTIELGRVRMNEMAPSFGDISILAEQLSIDLDELLSSITTLTIQGIKYNKAATQLRGIFVKLLKPTGAMKDLLFDMGVDSGEAAIQIHGLGGFLSILQERTKGSSSELAKYISRIRGLSGALAFAGEGLALYEGNLYQIQNAQESYAIATELVMQSAGKKLEIEINKIKNYFLVDLGDSILRYIAEVTNGFGGLQKVVKAFTDFAIAALIGTAATGLVGLLNYLGKTLASMEALKIAMASHPFFLFGAAVTASILLVDSLIVSTKEAYGVLKKEHGDIVEQSEKEFARRAAAEERHLRDVESAMRQVTQVYALEVTKQIVELNRGLKARVTLAEESEAGLKIATDKMLSGFRKYLSELNSEADKYEKNVKNTANTIAKLELEADQKIFEWEINVSDSKINLFEQRLLKVKGLREQALASGDRAKFELYDKSTRKLYEDLVKLAEKEGSTRLRYIEAYKNNIEVSKGMMEDLARIEEQKAKDLRKQERIDTLRFMRYQEQVKIFREFDESKVIKLSDETQISDAYDRAIEATKRQLELTDKLKLGVEERGEVEQRLIDLLRNKEANLTAIRLKNKRDEIEASRKVLDTTRADLQKRLKASEDFARIEQLNFSKITKTFKLSQEELKKSAITHTLVQGELQRDDRSHEFVNIQKAMTDIIGIFDSGKLLEGNEDAVRKTLLDLNLLFASVLEDPKFKGLDKQLQQAIIEFGKAKGILAGDTDTTGAEQIKIMEKYIKNLFEASSTRIDEMRTSIKFSETVIKQMQGKLDKEIPILDEQKIAINNLNDAVAKLSKTIEGIPGFNKPVKDTTPDAIINKAVEEIMKENEPHIPEMWRVQYGAASGVYDGSKEAQDINKNMIKALGIEKELEELFKSKDEEDKTRLPGIEGTWPSKYIDRINELMDAHSLIEYGLSREEIEGTTIPSRDTTDNKTSSTTIGDIHISMQDIDPENAEQFFSEFTDRLTREVNNGLLNLAPKGLV